MTQREIIVYIHIYIFFCRNSFRWKGGYKVVFWIYIVLKPMNRLLYLLDNDPSYFCAATSLVRYPFSETDNDFGSEIDSDSNFFVLLPCTLKATPIEQTENVLTMFVTRTREYLIFIEVTDFCPLLSSVSLRYRFQIVDNNSSS